MRYRLLEPAQSELAAAVDYYEHESAGLGGRFLDEFEITMDRIMRYPQA